MSRPSVARTRDGYRLEISRDIDAEQTAAWELLADTRRWPEWGPSVRAVDCDDDRIQADSTGRVRLPGGLWLPFEIEECTPPDGEQPGRWSWRVARIPATGHRVEPLEGRTRVVFEIPPRWGWLRPGLSPRTGPDRIDTWLSVCREEKCGEKQQAPSQDRIYTRIHRIQ